MGFVLLMRYRDLGENDVIYKHRDIIRKTGFCWAGWWAKPNEELPVEGINYIEEEIKRKEKATLYLYDSDSDELHKAVITQLHYDKNGGRVESPDKANTPEYYQDSFLVLWFKIETISIAVELDCLSQISYADDSLFRVSNDSDFRIYDNTKVGSLNGIKAQRRTLILLRDSQPGDKEFNYCFDNNSIYSNAYSVTNSDKILVFSDIHFSEKESTFAFSDCNHKKLRTKNTLLKAIDEAVDDQERFAAAICAGDVTCNSTTSEFEKAESFLFNLSNTYSIDKNNIIVVPGNHDFSVLDNNNNETADEPEIVDVLESSKKSYGDFYAKFYGKCKDEYFCVARRFLLHNQLPIEIIGINSSTLQQYDKHFRSLGYVGNDQLQLIAKKMKWDETLECNYSYRIMVLHHHLYPVDWSLEPKTDFTYSTCLDSGMILSFAAKYKIDLIIHGHKHKWNFIQTSGRTDDDTYILNILGLGSAASRDVKNAVGNSIGILDFSEENWLKIKILALSENGPAVNREVFSRRLPIKKTK